MAAAVSHRKDVVCRGWSASTNRCGGACVRSPPDGTECKFIPFEYGIGSFPDFAYLYGRNAADAAESIIRDEKSRSLYRSRRECRQRTVHLPRCRRIVGRLPDRGCLYARGAGAQSPAGNRILQQTPPRDAGGPSQCGSFGHRGIGGGFRRRGHHPECRRPARTRRFDPCDASARRTAETPLLARSRVDRSDRRVGTAVGCHGPRRGAAASAYRLFRRGGSPVRPCGADCGGGRRVDRRRSRSRNKKRGAWISKSALLSFRGVTLSRGTTAGYLRRRPNRPRRPRWAPWRASAGSCPDFRAVLRSATRGRPSVRPTRRPNRSAG